MIGALHILTPMNLGFFFVDSLWAGTVLRGIHLVLSGGVTAAQVNLGFAVCGSVEPTRGNFEGGVSLIRSLTLPIVDLPYKIAFFRATTGLSSGVYIGANYPVRSGAEHVICAAQSATPQYALMSLDVEPERLVRPAIERGRAARAWPPAGSVLDELRLEAIAAAG